jgi:hypothetical protein
MYICIYVYMYLCIYVFLDVEMRGTTKEGALDFHIQMYIHMYIYYNIYIYTHIGNDEQELKSLNLVGICKYMYINIYIYI